MPSAAGTLDGVRSIVTAIDHPWRERIEDAWGEIKALFNLRRELAGQTEPRIVLHVAAGYGEEMTRLLGTIAASTPRFEVRTGAPAILKGPRYLIYVPIEASDELTALHGRLWHEAAPLAQTLKAAYAPATWAPHLTLAMGHLPEEILTELQQFLAMRDWGWRLPIGNLCLVPDDASNAAPWTRFDLADAAG